MRALIAILVLAVSCAACSLPKTPLHDGDMYACSSQLVPSWYVAYEQSHIWVYHTGLYLWEVAEVPSSAPYSGTFWLKRSYLKVDLTIDQSGQQWIALKGGK